MTLPPAMIMRSLGLDPKMMAEVEKAMKNIDFVTIQEFVKQLPIMMERVERIDSVFQHMLETDSDLTTSIKVVYGSDAARGGV